ncbi:aminotransferase class I/II-fold pyridoxal phosphate-dependent enzyme [Afifella pfennigii]|uniref:aminotransferase class I/II-fold pyridoxal phosphate-dependent enzyme n=1 Tax=Afifella pfennigii TaxID=209897 RepID=UPI00047ECC14|nr:aminotransferase class I/II-fold pyridoxal phosphate-dependent enzyme [Afifella pfennigii]
MRHGGDPVEGAGLYGIVSDDWLDLSTGINPRPWPWRERLQASALGLERLPTRAEIAALEAAARQAYRLPREAEIVPLAGTELAIRQLPALIDRAAFLASSYSSYRAAFGDSLRPIAEPDEAEGEESLILVNPNNPDGRLLSPAAIARLAAERPQRLVVVDEAYADALPPHTSALPLLQEAGNLLVLRSFGKFYGLPGLRLGFAVGRAEPIRALRARLGDWPVSQAAIAIGAAALADRPWRQESRRWLASQAGALRSMLKRHRLGSCGHCPLFTLLRHPGATVLHRRLAQKGIWTRRFEERPDSLRLGLPADAAGLARLEEALSETLQGMRP